MRELEYGLIVSDIRNPFFFPESVASGVQDGAKQQGSAVGLCNARAAVPHLIAMATCVA